MADTDENVVSLLDISNEIIPSLNGHDPEALISMQYGPEKVAYNKHYGPKVMTKHRYLFILYLVKEIELFRSFGQEIENAIYFSVRNLEKVANYQGFKPEKISYERTRAIKHFLNYEQEGLVIHLEKNVPTKKDPSQAKRTDLFSLTEKGERYCMKIVDNLISALP